MARTSLRSASLLTLEAHERRLQTADCRLPTALLECLAERAEVAPAHVQEHEAFFAGIRMDGVMDVEGFARRWHAD